MLYKDFYENPTAHPRWDDEVRIEQEMQTLGQEKAQERIDKARNKGDLTTLRPQRSLIKDWIIPVSDEIAKWLQENGIAKGRGPRPKAHKLLVRIPTDTAALCGLRVLLKTLGMELRNLTLIAMEIGQWLEHEARALAWKLVEKDSWEQTVKKYAQRGSNAAHQRRARISLFNTYIKDKIGWQDWSDNDRLHVGLKVVDCICRGTKRFQVIPDPAWRGKTLTRRPYVVAPDEDLSEYLADAMDNELVFAPHFMPTLIPPRPWEGPRDGGYWTPFVKTPFLIRFKAHQENTRQRALDEFDALDMPLVYDALNAVQETPWRINTRVLEVANFVWGLDMGHKSMPRRRGEETLKRSNEERADHEMALKIWNGMDEEARKANPQIIASYREWARKAGAIHTRNAQRSSRYLSAETTLKVANRLKGEPRFYFPHMLDFRGRFYPIPSSLSPQGSDLHKGLLTFAVGKKVKEEDKWWLAINLANAFGVDKVSYEERVAWVLERGELWEAIYDDPLAHREWLDADDGGSAWQALAAILEWVGYLTDPENFVSYLPIRVDGSCNGIQHLSTMVLDKDGGEAVNLVPGESPEDIYARVAAEVTRLLEEDQMADDPRAFVWLALFKGKCPRSVTKRPVMIVPYGGTIHAYFEYTMDWLLEHDPKHVAIQEDEAFKMVGYLVRLIAKAMEGRIGRSMEVMQWLKKNCAKAAATGKALTWTTPSGFYCRQFYGTMETKKAETIMDGQRVTLMIKEATNDLDAEAQGQAIAPNFVHSQDASCLVLAVNKAYRAGVDAITTIHDSYGALAADMYVLNACIREAFIENYSTPVLEQFQGWCQFVNPKEKNWPDLPEEGELDIEEIRQSTYFFA